MWYREEVPFKALGIPLWTGKTIMVLSVSKLVLSMREMQPTSIQIYNTLDFMALDKGMEKNRTWQCIRITVGVKSTRLKDYVIWPRIPAQKPNEVIYAKMKMGLFFFQLSHILMFWCISKNLFTLVYPLNSLITDTEKKEYDRNCFWYFSMNVSKICITFVGFPSKNGSCEKNKIWHSAARNILQAHHLSFNEKFFIEKKRVSGKSHPTPNHCQCCELRRHLDWNFLDRRSEKNWHGQIYCYVPQFSNVG